MYDPKKLRDQAALLLEEADRLENFPQDENPHLTVLMWTQRFRAEYGRLYPLTRPFPANGGREYHYVAVKIGEWWYVTGKEAGQKRDWATLVSTHLSKATHIWFVSEWTEVDL